MTEQVHIIGGGSGIGHWIAEQCFGTRRIYCYDVDPCAHAARNTPCCIVANGSYHHFREQFRPGDWILLGVPPAATDGVLASVLDVAGTGSLFVALQSVQGRAMDLLRARVSAPSVPLGCHLLFSNAMTSPLGQMAVLTGYDERHVPHRRFRQALWDTGLATVELDAHVHDEYMAMIQGLTHFVLLAFTAALTLDGAYPERLVGLRTPSFYLLYALASRVAELTSSTLVSIQGTIGASRVRQAFLAVSNRLHEELERATHPGEAASVIDELRTRLSGPEADKAAAVARSVLDGLQMPLPELAVGASHTPEGSAFCGPSR